MSNTYTPNTKIACPALGDTGWSVPIVANYNLLDALSPLGGLCCTTKEQPSTTLNVAVASGQYVAQDGSVATFAGSTSTAIPTASTRVLYLDLASAGALTVAASYPATAHVRIATVAAGASVINSIADNRQCFAVCGPWADGVNIALGTATGTQIGTATAQKLGFLGVSPVSRQTGGAATASGTYGATEQGMIQKAYDCLRSFGLLS